MAPDLTAWESVDLERAPVRGPVVAGGTLEPAFVYAAYRHGLYPVVAWSEAKIADLHRRFGERLRSGEVVRFDTSRADPLELTWLSPDPRAIVRAADFHEGRDVRFAMRRSGWSTTVDRAFGEVIRACREEHPKTWLTPDVIETYEALHRDKLAHSVEVWDGDDLVGGVYGILTGRVFSPESMFHRVKNASKTAFVDLARRLVLSGILYIDCQQLTPYLAAFGAVEVPRARYVEMLRRCRDMPVDLFAEPMPLEDWLRMTVGDGARRASAAPLVAPSGTAPLRGGTATGPALGAEPA